MNEETISAKSYMRRLFDIVSIFEIEQNDHIYEKIKKYEQKEILVINSTNKIGGAEKSLLQYLSQVPDLERDKYLVALPLEAGNLSKILSNKGYDILELDVINYNVPYTHPKYYIKTISTINMIVNNLGINTIYSNQEDFGPFISILNLIKNIRTVTHVRGKKTTYEFFFLHLNIQTHTIFNSEFVKNSSLPDRLTNKLNFSNIHVVYNSIDSSSIPEETTRKDRNDDRVILGMFGRFVPWKNFDYVIKQCCDTDIYNKFDRLMLVGAQSDLGNQNYEQELRALINNKDKKDKVELVDFQENVWPYYSKCDIVIVPSIEEPFGRVPIEVGLLGIPVLAANSGGLREIINSGENGYLFDLESDSDFEEKLTDLIEDIEKRDSFGSAMKEDVETKFHPEKYYKNVHTILE